MEPINLFQSKINSKFTELKRFPKLPGFMIFSIFFAVSSFFLISWNGCTYEYSPPVEPFVRGLWGVSLRKCFVRCRLFFIFFKSFLFFVKICRNLLADFLQFVLNAIGFIQIL